MALEPKHKATEPFSRPQKETNCPCQIWCSCLMKIDIFTRCCCLSALQKLQIAMVMFPGCRWWNWWCYTELESILRRPPGLLWASKLWTDAVLLNLINFCFDLSKVIFAAGAPLFHEPNFYANTYQNQQQNYPRKIHFPPFAHCPKLSRLTIYSSWWKTRPGTTQPN